MLSFLSQSSHVVVTDVATCEWNLRSCGLLVAFLSIADADCCVAASKARVFSSTKFFRIESVGDFFLVIKVPNIFSFRRAISLPWGTRKRCPHRPRLLSFPRLLSANLCSLTVSMRSLSAFGFSIVFGFCETIAWTWARKIRCLLLYIILRMSHAVLKFASPFTDVFRYCNFWLSVVWLSFVTAALNWSKQDVQTL